MEKGCIFTASSDNYGHSLQIIMDTLFDTAAKLTSDHFLKISFNVESEAISVNLSYSVTNKNFRLIENLNVKPNFKK